MIWVCDDKERVGGYSVALAAALLSGCKYVHVKERGHSGVRTDRERVGGYSVAPAARSRATISVRL